MSDFCGFKSQAEESWAGKLDLNLLLISTNFGGGPAPVWAAHRPQPLRAVPAQRGSLQAAAPQGGPSPLSAWSPPAERGRSPSRLSVCFLNIFAEGDPLFRCRAELRLAAALGFLHGCVCWCQIQLEPVQAGCWRSPLSSHPAAFCSVPLPTEPLTVCSKGGF